MLLVRWYASCKEKANSLQLRRVSDQTSLQLKSGSKFVYKIVVQKPSYFFIKINSIHSCSGRFIRKWNNYLRTNSISRDTERDLTKASINQLDRLLGNQWFWHELLIEWTHHSTINYMLNQRVVSVYFSWWGKTKRCMRVCFYSERSK